MIDNTTMLRASEIKIGADRQRRAIAEDHIRDLAQSIQTSGLIHNIIVDKTTGQLIAGECRLRAFELLRSSEAPCPWDYDAWNLIPARLAEFATQEEIEIVELEENLKRRDLSWQESANAILRIHKFRETQSEEWSGNDTGRLLGLSSQHVSKILQVGRAIEAAHPKIKEAKGISEAYNILWRENERTVANELGALDAIESVKDEPIEVEIPANALILNTPFEQFIREYSGPKFNFIHCDFPYGINHEKTDQGNRAGWETYEDSEETYAQLIALLLGPAQSILLPSCHIMFWFSMNYYEWTKTQFEAAGWVVEPYPLIWHKSDGKGILPDPRRGPRRIYETALLMHRGDRPIVKAVANLYSAPNRKEIHMSEKPESMLRHFFQLFVDENSVVLDPTCGSGTSIRAADALGAKVSIGIEINPEFAQAAQHKLDNARALRMAAG